MDETKTEAIRVRLDPELYAKFSRFCKKNKMSQSMVIRMALKELLYMDEIGKIWDEGETNN